METPTEICMNCRYWEAYGKGTSYGECHRFPPSTSSDGFPETYSKRWCGEWKEVEEKKREWEKS